MFCILGWFFFFSLSNAVLRNAWVRRPKGAKDNVKQARSAQSRTKGPPTRSQGPDTSSFFFIEFQYFCAQEEEEDIFARKTRRLTSNTARVVNNIFLQKSLFSLSKIKFYLERSWSSQTQKTHHTKYTFHTQSCLHSLSSFKRFPVIFPSLSGMSPVLVIWQCLEPFYKSCFLARRTHWHHCTSRRKPRCGAAARPTKPQKIQNTKYQKLNQISNSLKLISWHHCWAGGVFLLNCKVWC